MPKLIDLRGKRFGRLTVLNDKYIRKNNATYWKCQCDCGNQKLISSGNLMQGKTKSCGCLQHKDYEVDKRLVTIFKGMRQRCYYPKHKGYKRYGGRGIKICDEWLNDRTKFYRWSLENGYRNDLTIDRIDNNGNYEPTNCRWVSIKEQENNRTNNHKITINGQMRTIAQWAEMYGITHQGFYDRCKRKGLI